MSELNHWLVLHIEDLNNKELIDTLNSYNELINKGAHLNSAVATVMMAEIRSRFELNPKINFRMLEVITRVKDAFDEAKIDIIPFCQDVCRKYISPLTFPALPLHENARILSSFSRLRMSEPSLVFETKDKEDIFTLANTYFSSLPLSVNTSNSRSWCRILNAAVTGHWGEASFIEKLEKEVLGNISIVPRREVLILAEEYLRVHRGDFMYLQEKFYQPLLEDMRKDKRKWEPEKVTNILLSFLRNLNQPLYCTPSLVSFLSERINDSDWLSKSNQQEGPVFVQKALRYLATSGEFQIKELYAQIAKYLIANGQILSPREEVYAATSFSEALYTDESYWQYILTKMSRFAGHPSSRAVLYPLLVNLKYTNKVVYEEIMKVGGMRKEVIELEKERRKNQREILEKRSKRGEVSRVRNYFVSQKIRYDRVWNGDYTLDFAFPEKKIAFDVCKNNDIVMPKNSLTASSLIKQTILAKKGWEFVVIPRSVAYQPKALQETIEKVMQKSR